MEELLNMGFSSELAAQALAATGPNSSLQQAADWILTHHHNHSPPKSSTTVQPSLDRFFTKPSQTTPSSPSPSPSPSPPSPPPPPKRLKPATTPSPLSDRMRPSSLSQLLGQDHLTSILAAGQPLPSLILWGPPGSGKTSTARALSHSLPSNHRFLPLSAVSSNLSDLRSAISDARRSRTTAGLRTVLFVDEIHRFSKPHLDALLPPIEDGSLILLAATTENPSFHLTTPLLSRARVLSLHPLQPHHIATLLRRAISDVKNGLQITTKAPVTAHEDTVQFLSLHCDGDARVVLNSLEIAASLALNRGASEISVNDAKEAMQSKHLAYDRDGEEHYNLISALHKSMRGNDANAAVYWLVRMLEGGEQPLYIARRLVRFASEDVGMADPAALEQAVACYQACHFLGMPECDVNLAQCVVYLAMARKSVAVYKALGEARRAVRESKGGNEGVPLHLRNAPTRLMKEMGYGKGYVYTPEDPEGSKSQTYLPPSLQGRKFLDWPPSSSSPQDEQRLQ